MHANGILLNYKLNYNNTHYTDRSCSVEIAPNVVNTSLIIIGGSTYFFSLHAFTIRAGPAVLLGPVAIPQYRTYTRNNKKNLELDLGSFVVLQNTFNLCICTIVPSLL